jgi:hypothetical protein
MGFGRQGSHHTHSGGWEGASKGNTRKISNFPAFRCSWASGRPPAALRGRLRRALRYRAGRIEGACGAKKFKDFFRLLRLEQKTRKKKKIRFLAPAVARNLTLPPGRALKCLLPLAGAGFLPGSRIERDPAPNLLVSRFASPRSTR